MITLPADVSSLESHAITISSSDSEITRSPVTVIPDNVTVDAVDPPPSNRSPEMVTRVPYCPAAGPTLETSPRSS